MYASAKEKEVISFSYMMVYPKLDTLILKQLMLISKRHVVDSVYLNLKADRWD